MALIQVDFKSLSLQRRVRINVVLPADLEAEGTQTPYQTLYLLHGIFGDANSWLLNSNVARYAEEKNLCLVMPDGENGFYLDHPDRLNLYSTYVGQELVRITRRMFPLSARREDTFIGGFSMGGYGALRTGLRYPDTFGAICALSSALILDSYVRGQAAGPTSDSYLQAMFGSGDVLHSDLNPIWLVRQILAQGRAAPRLYLSCGEQDFLLDANRQFHEELTALAVPHTFSTCPGRHDWDFWDRECAFLIRSWLPTAAERRDAAEEIR